MQPRSRPRALETVRETPSSRIYRLAGARPGDKSVIAKRGPSERITIEHVVYTTLLPQLPLPRLECFGVHQESSSSSWLFLEEAVGEPFDRHISPHRIASARWLATLHLATADLPPSQALPQASAARHLVELGQIRATAAEAMTSSAPGSEEHRAWEQASATFDRVAAAWVDIDARVRQLRSTLVHGELAPKHIRVRPARSGATLLALDWGGAAWGQAAVDLGLVDLPSYASMVGRRWPDQTLDVVRGAANAGKVFRWLAAFRTAASSGAAGAGPERRAHTVRELARGLATALDELEGRLTLVAAQSSSGERW